MIRFGQAHQAEVALNGQGKMPYKMNDWKNLSAECGDGTIMRPFHMQAFLKMDHNIEQLFWQTKTFLKRKSSPKEY